jgi:hypothetical protein
MREGALKRFVAGQDGEEFEGASDPEAVLASPVLGAVW